MKQTKLKLQLVDKSIKHPSGIVEDILVKVDIFLFPVDFIVMDIEKYDEVTINLGRPFMKTTWMLININDGNMKVRLHDDEVSF